MNPYGSSSLEPGHGLPKIQESTRGTLASVVKHFNTQATDNNYITYEEFTIDDIVNGDMRMYLGEFIVYLSSDRFKQASGSHYKVGTTVQYVQTLWADMKRRFDKQIPNNDLEWMEEQIGLLSKEIQRRDVKETVEDSSAEPVYKVVTPDLTNDWFPNNIDLVTICQRLCRETKEKDPALKRLEIVFTYHGDGRTGEVKFMNYSNWRWDLLLKCLVMRWSEEKVLRISLQCFGTDRDGYACDIFHTFAWAAVASDILYRERNCIDGKIKKRDYFVLPKAKSNSQSWITRRITDTLREHVPEPYKGRVQGKSLRIAATTTLSIHPQMQPYYLNARGGWALPDNSKVYIRSTKAASLPGMRALNGQKDIFKNYVPPCLQALVTKGLATPKQLQSFIDNLYVISFDEFMENGHLRPFLEACTGSLVRYYSQTIEECNVGVGLIVHTKMERAFEQANCSLHGSLSTKECLRDWSECLEEDNLAQNMTVTYTTDASTASDIGEVQGSITSLSREVRCLQATVNAQNAKIASQDRTLQAVNTQLVQQTQLLQQLLATQQGGGPPVAHSMPLPAPTATLVTLLPQQQQDQEGEGRTALTEPPPKRQRSIHDVLRPTSVSRGKSKSVAAVPNNKNISIVEFLRAIQEDMVHSGHIAEIPSAAIYNKLDVQQNNRAKLDVVVRMVSRMCTEEQDEVLCSKDSPSASFLDAANAVSKRIMDQLFVWEGRSEASSRLKPTFIAVANRFLAIANAYARSHKLANLGNLDLLEMLIRDHSTEAVM